MLPARSAQARNRRSNWLPTVTATILSLLVLCVVMPFILWQYSSLPQSPAAATERQALTPLQQLQQQRSTQNQHDPVLAGADSPGNVTEAQRPQAPVSTTVLDTADQLTAAQKYLHSVQHPTKRQSVPASRYVIEPEPYDMRQQHKQVKAFLGTVAFASQQAARKANGGRGIIINAGGPHLLSSAIVTIKVLREVHNCSLPIELVWHSPTEMDPTTLSVLQAQWGPIRGVDLSHKPWPDHHRWPPALDFTGEEREAATSSGNPDDFLDKLPAERASAKLRGFLYKVWSLAASSFASALLLDADNLPLMNPEGLWDDASFKLYGNLFWPDFWPPGTSEEAQELVYDMVGLDAHQAADVLAAGKGPGMSGRATESGQVLLDLVRQGDVAEWALWINSFGDTVYRAVWGDKDAYALAFAVAGKAHKFNQVQVPPSGAFTWRPQSVLVKETETKMDGWQLAGMVQFDALSQHAFLHRTMNKLSINGEAWPIGLLTAPLSQSWIQYYLSLDSLGPTVGVPVTYAAPDTAFKALSVDLPATDAPRDKATGLQSDRQAAPNRHSINVCPTKAFSTYWKLRQHAVPLGPIPWLDTACSSHLSTLLGPLAPQYSQSGFITHPEVLALGLTSHTGVQPGSGRGLGHSQNHGGQLSIADATPVLAWAMLADTAAAAASNVARSIQASYDALEWLRQHRTTFPLMASSGGSMSSEGASIGKLVHRTPAGSLNEVVAEP